MSMQIKIPIPIQLGEIKIKITEATKPVKNIVGFAEVVITDSDDNILFKIRGYTIKVFTSKENPNPFFKVDAPAYPGRFRMNKSFIMDNKNMWEDVVKAILSGFEEETGGKKPKDYSLEEEVNPNDIPF